MVSTTQRMGEAVEEPTETAEADAAVSDEFRDSQEVIDLSAEVEQADAPTQATTETTSTTGGNVVTIDATNLSVDTVITPEMLSGGMTTVKTCRPTPL